MSNKKLALKRFLEHCDKEFPQLQQSLNTFFDGIGFSEQAFLKREHIIHGDKSVRDNIWGMIDISRQLLPLVDNPVFQRLRRISQLGFSSYTYPTAVHTRFDHSLGVYATCKQLIQEIEQTHNRTEFETSNNLTATKFTPRDQALLLRAAILHDIGHGPFSHVSETYFKRHEVFVDTKKTFGGVSLNALR